MKKQFLLVLLVSLLAVGLVISCGDDNVKLDGTTWEASVTEDGITMTIAITFTATNYTMTMKGLPFELGTYTVEGNTVFFTNSEGTYTGVVSGNTLTLKDDDGDDMVFTRK